MPARAIVLLILGGLMLGLGTFVVGRLLATGAALTRNPWLDGAFAAFFILRGAANVVKALRHRHTGP